MVSKFLRVFDWLLHGNRYGRTSLGLVLLAFLVWWLFGAKIEQISSIEQRDASAKPAIENVLAEQPMPTMQDVGSAPPIATTPSLTDEFRSIESAAMEERIDLLLLDFEQLERGLENWRQHVADLSASDSGRRIVSNEQSFPTAMTLVLEEIVTATDLLSLQKRMQALQRERAAQLTRSPMEELTSAVEQTEQQVKQVQDTLDKTSLALSEIEQQSQRLPLAQQTLAEAMAEHDRTLAANEAKLRQERKEQAERERAENQAKHAAMKAELEIEKQNAIAAAEQDRLKLEAEAVRIKGIDDAARLRLAAEFDRELPDIQHYLGRLFETGYTQPISPGQFGSVEKPGPVSLAAIKKVGALNDRVDGLSGAYAYFLTMMVTPTNDRQQAGPYPANYLGSAPTTEQAAAARPGYTLLKKYQTILVERGYLQP